ncbi:hypothetical protein [Faecalispora jeddahensis]|uniref:hypothetical protein n=1 Tax=Faecalispora jeddahensis TaxID=1414721 RepID=UPI0028A5BBD6|nr:hypothetical protein [Faecalispora jeddahensis]
MAEKFFPFNSVSGDREYDAEDFAAYFADILSSGVSANGDNLGVTPAGGLNLSVGPGRALIKGHQYRNTATITLSVSAGASNPRIDRVVARLDVAARRPFIAVVPGTPSNTPTPPALTRNDDYYEIGLASIDVAASAISISAANITDTRTDSNVCGVVRCLVEKLDVSAFMQNSQTAFNEWFAGVQDILDADTAGNLLNLINTHKADGNVHISTALHTRIGTTHNLEIEPGAKNLTFLATADIVEGDTWTVNGNPVTAVLQNGEALPGELFKAGCWVTGVRLSDDGTQLFFRAGASTVPSIFGNGSDGDAVISGTVTLPVPVPHQSIIEKHYKSLYINAGAILRAAAFNAGLIIRVKGDCTIHGTIDQSGLAPKTNSQNTYAYPSQLVCGNGGNGGNGGAGYNRTPPVGGTGMLRRTYGGGYGGGAAGGSSNSYYEDNVYYEGGIGGSSTGTTIETYSLFRGGPTSTSAGGNAGSYGGGGSGAGTSNSSASGGSGGDGGGGNGNAGTYVKSGNWSYYGGGGGGAGNYGGGVILLYVGGNLIIDGYLKANGLNGGNGGANASTNFILCGSGGGGGGGGGAIYIYYKGSYSNTGIMQVNGGSGGSRGGVGGTGSGTPSVVGAAGTVGSITVIQHTN